MRKIVALFLITIVFPAFSQIYMYKDKKGRTVITDAPKGNIKHYKVFGSSKRGWQTLFQEEKGRLRKPTTF